MPLWSKIWIFCFLHISRVKVLIIQKWPGQNFESWTELLTNRLTLLSHVTVWKHLMTADFVSDSRELKQMFPTSTWAVTLKVYLNQLTIRSINVHSPFLEGIPFSSSFVERVNLDAKMLILLWSFLYSDIQLKCLERSVSSYRYKDATNTHNLGPVYKDYLYVYITKSCVL